MSIEVLTTELCSKIRANAAVALYGNKTCNLENLNKSCFASESCAYNFNASEIDTLLYSPYHYIMVNHISDINIEFIACIAADEIYDNVPYFHNIRSNGKYLFVHTLCVESKQRNVGYARKRVDYIR